MQPSTNKWNDLNKQQQIELLARPALANSASLSSIVAEIITQVQSEGDNALFDLTEKFDGIRLSSLQVSTGEIASAEAELKPAVKAAIESAYNQINIFHKAQQAESIVVETAAGVTCELHTAPIDVVGLYIPGGSAVLPSTVLMLGTPAQIAGCERAVICTPPRKDGSVTPEIRYAASLCGINEIYKTGGAQAIAAMAFGTESIAKVDKIYGPGNSFVTEAKQQVSQAVGGAAIDMPAGPSEVLVLADGNANPAYVAADLLSQAEHGADSQAILVSDSADLIAATQAEVKQQLAKLPRREIATQAIAHSRYILAQDLAQAAQVSNAYAPEHLIVQTDDARALLPKLKYAGSIFLGKWTPESAGDYASGTNHVLPTYGYSRTYSSLGLADFTRRYTVQELSLSGLQNIGDAIMDLAEAEGLDAHRNAVAIRLQDEQS